MSFQMYPFLFRLLYTFRPNKQLPLVAKTSLLVDNPHLSEASGGICKKQRNTVPEVLNV